MHYHQKEFNKNTLIIPIFACIIIGGIYAASKLSQAMKPMTLEEYERRYVMPEIPQPFIAP